MTIHNITCLLFALAIVYIVMYIFDMNAISDVFIGILGSIFVWYGLWRICELLEEQLQLDNKKIESSAFFTSIGFLMILIESKRHSLNDLISLIG